MRHMHAEERSRDRRPHAEHCTARLSKAARHTAEAAAAAEPPRRKRARRAVWHLWKAPARLEVEESHNMLEDSSRTSSGSEQAAIESVRACSKHGNTMRSQFF